MGFDPNTLGRRLREARENCGVSQQIAADAIGAPRTAVTQLEAGHRAVSTLELARLADLYKQSVADFFREEPLHEDDLLVALHRLAPGLDVHADIKNQVQRCLDLCREGCSLEELLGRSSPSGPPTYPVTAPRTAGDAVRQGEHVAHQERQRLGLGPTPIADMGELIADQGIWSSGVSLSPEMSGLFLHHPSIGLAILVNFAHARARQRFSYAHEYAHALLDRERTVTVSTRDNASELIEKRANAFAAAFLMPSEGVAAFLRALDKGLPSRLEHAIFDVATEGRIDTHVRPVPGSQAITHQDVALLAHHFGASYHAAVYRLKSLNGISPSACAQLLERESAGKAYLDFLNMLDDLDAPETQERQDRELKSHVVHLAIEAYRRDAISRGKLLDLSKKLALSGRTLIELAEAVKDD
jgi:Zn-dependent peptidase ImmA (M78 family)/transcriptional regulator with XRE-family HTH domain